MNRDNQNQHQPEAPHVAECDRAEQLVTYFYGEANVAEADEFQHHLAQCAACREELTAFDSVRRAVDAWRSEALDQATAPSFQFQIIPASTAAKPFEHSVHPARCSHHMPKRSALGALRAVFDLSPLWLRVSGVATAAAVCVLAALAVFGAEVRWDSRGLVAHTGVARERMVTQANETPAQAAVMPVEQAYTASQVETLIAERVEQKRAELLAEVKNQISMQQASSVTPKRNVNAPVTVEVVRRSQTRRRNSNVVVPAPPAAQRLGEPLVNAADREPHLYDLLGEVD